MPNQRLVKNKRSFPRLKHMVSLFALALFISVSGCSSFLSPAFMTLIAAPAPGQTGEVSGFTMDNATGHVPIFFINNTRFDQNLLDYLEESGVDVSNPNLRPRVRASIDIYYTNGNVNTVEFVDGSAIVEEVADDRNFATPPELTDLELNNVVAVCDIDRIEPSSVEIYVPVTLTAIGYVETDNNIYREITGYISPRFVDLLPDELDSDNDVTVVRNFDIRNSPVMVNSVQCGSVIGFTISGTLNVSFDFVADGVFIPGYLEDDEVSQAANPGRFKFTTNVR